MTDIVWQSIVLQAVSFLVFVLLLSRMFFGPVLRLMENRQSRVSKLHKQAEADEAEARSVERRIRYQLEDARREAGAVMEKFRAEAESKREEQLAAVRERAQKLRESNTEEIRRQVDSVLEELQPETAEIGRLIAEKVVGRRLAG